MSKNLPFSELNQKLASSQKVLVILPARPEFDQVASALSLFLSLEESGKTTSLVCPTPMTVEFNHLVGVDRIETKVKGRDLTITFNYPAEQIEKVSYNDDNNQPNLVIQPKVGAPPISESLASYSYAGANFDLVLAVGLKDQSQLNIAGASLAENYIVNLDNDPANSNFGQLNLVDLEVLSLGEIVLALIKNLNLPLNVDIAQNLLDGLWRATDGLTAPGLGADSYEMVAACLRAGAQKPQPGVSQRNLSPKRPFGESRRGQSPFRAETKDGGNQLSGQNQPQPVGNQPQKQPRRNPPQDWFEPKIFKGTDIS